MPATIKSVFSYKKMQCALGKAKTLPPHIAKKRQENGLCFFNDQFKKEQAINKKWDPEGLPPWKGQCQNNLIQGFLIGLMIKW